MSEHTMPGLDEAAIEEIAERLQCADIGVDYPFTWMDEADGPDGPEYSAWMEQPHAEQERWRGLARLAYPVIAAAVREQVAQEIETDLPPSVVTLGSDQRVGGIRDGLHRAARVARGGAR